GRLRLGLAQVAAHRSARSAAIAGRMDSLARPVERRGLRVSNHDCLVAGAGYLCDETRHPHDEALPFMSHDHQHHHHDGNGRPTKARTAGVPVIGIGGPVGSGKTALVEALCRELREKYSLAVVTNDIFTKEDAEFLTRRGVLPVERIRGVETGGCPHTAIREDASHNQEAIDDLVTKLPDVNLILLESGGDNLAATFSPELADRVIYVID